MDLLALCIAWIGHAALWTVTLNIAYSRPWHKTVLRTYRAIVALVIAGVPLWALAQRPIADAWANPIIYYGYFLPCLFLGGIVVPAITIYRNVRPRPKQVIAEQSRIVDVQAVLGEVPSGPGKRHWMSQLPLNQVYQVEFTHLTLRLPNWPRAWHGLTVLQLSDLHFIGTPNRAFYRVVVEEAMREGVPDLLVITGDLVDSNTHHRWVIPALGRLRWNLGAFAILGNHDWWYQDMLVRKRLQRLGMTVLNNTFTTLPIHGIPLTVIGHEGPWYRPAPDLSQCPPGYRLLLSHTPDNIAWARRQQVGLMLSGHNHGGQIRIPGFGSIFVPSGYSRRYDQGHFDEGETFLHVNRGVAGKAPLRFFCRPQVTRFTIESGE